MENEVSWLEIRTDSGRLHCVHGLSGSTAGVLFIDGATADFSRKNIHRGVTWSNDSKRESDITKCILFILD